jgi:hypothetical protein
LFVLCKYIWISIAWKHEIECEACNFSVFFLKCGAYENQSVQVPFYKSTKMIFLEFIFKTKGIPCLGKLQLQFLKLSAVCYTVLSFSMFPYQSQKKYQTLHFYPGTCLGLIFYQSIEQCRKMDLPSTNLYFFV